MARKKKTDESQSSDTWPKVVVGNHLTVTTYENGKTELQWDDAALFKEVQEAIASVEVKTEIKPKRRKV